MKRLLFLLLVFVITNKLFSSEFELMPLNINYYGAVSTGNNTIVYGDYGSYLLSSNNGVSWKQYSLNEYGKINKIVNYKDTLWGIIEEGFVIKSIDDGKSWSKIKLLVTENEKIYDIFVFDNNILIKTNFELKLINRQFDCLKTLSKLSDSSLIKDGYINQFTDSLFIFNTWTKNPKSYIILNQELSEIRTVNIEEKIPKINKNSIYFYFAAYKINDSIVIDINHCLYYTDINLSYLNYFYKDNYYLNPKNPDFKKKWFDMANLNYFAFNNNLYIHSFKDVTNNKILKSHSPASLGGGFSSIMQLYQFNSDIQDYIKYGSSFSNYYVTIGSSEIDRNLTFDASLYSKMICLNNNWIKTGNSKSVLYSSDFSSDWKLLSCLNGKPIQIINDSTYYFINDKLCTNEIYRTDNYGDCFLPSELGLNIDTSKTYKRENGIIVDSIINIDTVSYFSIFSSNSVFYISEDGNGIFGGPLDFGTDFKVNFAYTKNGGKKYKFIKKDIRFDKKDNSFNTNVKYIDGKYLFAYCNTDLANYDKYFHRKYILDTNMEKSFDEYYDNLYVIHYFVADNLKNYYMLTSAQDNDDLNKIRFEIRETNDSGKTSKTICSIDKELFLDQIYEHNLDSIFFTTTQPAELYLYDRKYNKINQLYQASQNDTLRIMYLSNKYYLLGNNLYKENTDKSDLSKWKDSDWDYGRPSFSNVIFKGNVAIAKLKDSLRQENYYRIMPKKLVSVTNDTEIKYGKHFYASASYPMPGKNVVRSRISYDESFDLEESLNGVYNTYGERIEGKENLRVIKWGHAQAEIEWNCSHAPNGVYFIIVKHNGRNDCVPVIVER